MLNCSTYKLIGANICKSTLWFSQSIVFGGVSISIVLIVVTLWSRPMPLKVFKSVRLYYRGQSLKIRSLKVELKAFWTSKLFAQLFEMPLRHLWTIISRLAQTSNGLFSLWTLTEKDSHWINYWIKNSIEKWYKSHFPECFYWGPAIRWPESGHLAQS